MFVVAEEFLPSRSLLHQPWLNRYDMIATAIVTVGMTRDDAEEQHFAQRHAEHAGARARRHQAR